MNLVIINTLYSPTIIGGAERSVQFLAETLVRLGHTVTVVCTRERKGVGQAWVNGVKVYYIGLNNLYWPYAQNTVSAPKKLLWHLGDSYNPAMSREVGRILESEKPDVVHTNNISGFSVAVWREIKKRNLPLVHTLRDYYLICPRATMFRKGRNCVSQCLGCKSLTLTRKWTHSLVNTVVGNSAFILAKHLEHGYFSSAEQRVIYNGYETDTPLENAVRHPGHLRAGYLGQLTPTKGLAYCLEHMRNHFPDRLELYVAGKGEPEYEAYLRKQWPSDNVHYLGFIPPEEFFSKIDVLLVPSLWHEPLPRTAFEAYTHGKPIIGSNRGGIPELIDEGETGFIFNPDHPETLSRALKRFINEPILATKMRNACLEKARTFLPSRVTDDYQTVYQSLL